MELERVEDINQHLIDLFGIDSITGEPIWRVVWSEDQFEKRLTEFSDTGLKLLYPEVRELPKYRQWIRNKYVLERLVLVPDASIRELPAAKQSYEPIYVFQDVHGNALPPRTDACQFVVQAVYAAQGKGYVTVYKDPDAGLTTEQLVEQRHERIKDLENQLFGNESGLEGKTHLTGEGIVVPSNYKES